jgi:histidinol phosphatase-like enzyme
LIPQAARARADNGGRSAAHDPGARAGQRKRFRGAARARAHEQSSPDERIMHDRRPRQFCPLPGTTPAPHALFVDRWGTLLELPPKGFARSTAEVRFVAGAQEALHRACRAGWHVYLLGNEEAVWTGKLPDAAWKEIDAFVLESLKRAGVALQRNYVCLDHPQGIRGHDSDTVFLLPNTGAFYHASHQDGVQLGKSWVIGDSTLELVAGWRSGCRMAGVRTGRALADGAFHVEPELVGADLGEVVLTLLERESALTH